MLRDRHQGDSSTREPGAAEVTRRMTAGEIIQRSGEILGGVPVFAGTRVPARTLIDYLAAGERLDDFLDDFPTVSREQAVGMLELVKATLLAPRSERDA